MGVLLDDRRPGDLWCRRWSHALLADQTYVRDEASFMGSLRRRRLAGMTLISAKADSFVTSWREGGGLAGYIGLCVNQTSFVETVKYVSGTEQLLPHRIGLFDGAELLETEVMGSMQLTIALVDKRSMPLRRNSVATLRSIAADRHALPTLDLLGTVVTAVADNPGIGPAAAAIARDTIRDLLSCLLDDPANPAPARSRKVCGSRSCGGLTIISTSGRSAQLPPRRSTTSPCARCIACSRAQVRPSARWCADAVWRRPHATWCPPRT